ncbi:rod shape-determining protein MreD [Flavobacterium sp. F372]|jgi:rod shape-determining protein MreD|uniref:Rod shape-determining protein MreD n=1 Tax=Flavobacterium bernardetii TaxID=2813823 RepID=A0ABR7J0P3_9FLAO|nr:rod shape-determining protein MreD [Flavobacterium bernardetii]MBC5835518.1 rod shape-determining protein MreD [Flavobacterium bernardetii]NHF70882.1 rod shape-determining protein MreD [Flavobacterium bernardetii]
MNSNFILNLIRFIVLLTIQIVVLEQVKFGGWINPYLYILFIILYPINSNKSGFIAASFCLGLVMDLFCDSGGVHATACLLLAYFRPGFLKFAFGLSYEYQTIRIADKLSVDRFTFIMSAILFHHLVLFTLELYRFDLFFEVITRTILSTIFTFIICIISIYLIKPNKR